MKPHALQDKDIGKFNQALAQALDGISSKAAFIKVRWDGRTTPLGCVSTYFITALNVRYCDLVGEMGKCAEGNALSLMSVEPLWNLCGAALTMIASSTHWGPGDCEDINASI